MNSRDVSCARLGSASRSGKQKLAGDTYVDVGIEVAAGTLVPCNSFDQALTCHSISDSLVLAATMLLPASRASLDFHTKQ